MNSQARAIWKLIQKFDLLVCFEYVISDHNIADPPSRGLPMPCHSRDIERIHVPSVDALS